MNLMVPLALLCGLALATAGLSFFALFRARALVRAAQKRAQEGLERYASALESIQKTIDGVCAQIEDLKQHPAALAVAAPPKPGLNLSKRSQALRMHRRGDPPSQIATTLEIPVQEVDLLVKVHRIVMSSV